MAIFKPKSLVSDLQLQERK